MKKLLLSLAVIFNASAVMADDSVYAWGPWAEGVKPAAGPAYVAPSPVDVPNLALRESIEQLRQYNDVDDVISPPAYVIAEPFNPGIPQIAGDIIVCQTACGGSDGMNTGSAF